MGVSPAEDLFLDPALHGFPRLQLDGTSLDRGDAPSDLDQLYPRENGHRGHEGVLLRGQEQVAKVVDRAWQREDPGHLERARAAEGRIVLAGGLSPENVREAIEKVRPWAVDASSSLEVEPGIKDHERVYAFVEAAR